MFLLVNGQAEITEPEGNENFVTDVSDEVSEMLEKRRQARFDKTSEKSYKGKTFDRSADLDSI